MRFRTRTILTLLATALLPACASDRQASRGNADPSAREAAIREALQSDDRVAQINMQRLSLEVALQFLAKHMNADMRVDWDGLRQQGIDRDSATTTINLFNASYGDALRAVLWLLRPASGRIGYAVDNGILVIAPQPDTPQLETEAEKVEDLAITAKLRELVDLREIRGVELPADALFYYLGISKHLSLIVDWDELKKTGVSRDTTIAVTLDDTTSQEYLIAILDGLRRRRRATAFDIRHGMLRVSTPTRLEIENTAEDLVTNSAATRTN